MSISLAERHQIENEMLFRNMNEKVGDNLGALDASYIESNELFLIRDKDLLIKFKCECSDENCSLRIPLKLEQYQTAHTDRDSFVVLPDHQVEAIETVVEAHDTYNVVKKNNSTPAPHVDAPMHDTSIKKTD